MPGFFSNGKAGNYAFGLVVGDLRGVKKVDHSGSTAGYRAHLSRFPDRHTSVAVLCNSANGGATGSADAVAALYLLGKSVPEAPRINDGFSQELAPARPTAQQLSEYEGNYWSDEAETMLTVDVYKESGGAIIKRRPSTHILLVPTATDTFSAGSLGTITFRRDAAGKVNALSVGQDRVFDLRFAKTK
jgi:hypothetical protein